MAGKVISRRQFLKHAGAAAALLGLSEAMIPQLAKAMEEMAAQITLTGHFPVIWIQGQNCTGCSVSFLNSNYPMVAELVLDTLSVRYQPNVIAGTGDHAMEAIQGTVEAAKKGAKNGIYVLVVEGPIPKGDKKTEFCTFGLKDSRGKSLPGAPEKVPDDKSIYEWMKELVPNASAVVANGNCASFGGIPLANASTTGATPVQDIVNEFAGGKNIPLVNVGGCPSHPDWFVGTVLEALMALGLMKPKRPLDLDQYNRSKTFFGTIIHENCERRASFDAGLFLENWNDANPDMKLCMFKKGCKGPVTYADCPTRRWNSAVNWCVGANAPCNGCTEKAFYKDFSPLYEELPNVNFAGINPAADVLGWVAAGATAVGVGAHYLYKQLGKKPEEGSEGGEK